MGSTLEVLKNSRENNNNVFMAFYFVLFMIIGSLFILNLFVGVIIDNFNKIKESEEIGGRSLFLTESQRQWIELQHIMLQKKLIFQIPPPKNKCRFCCYHIVYSK
jgi:hypothetical protein